nr:MAG TPA: hypothetical protein [Caudoviricetes sp.]
MHKGKEHTGVPICSLPFRYFISLWRLTVF